MSWTLDRVIDLAKRMEAKVQTGFRVSAATAPLIVRALVHYAREHFGEPVGNYTIDIWTVDDSRLERHYAQCSDLFAAREAFRLAVEQCPRNPVTLRQGIRVIQSTTGQQ